MSEKIISGEKKSVARGLSPSPDTAHRTPHSAKEATRYLELLQLQNNGDIKRLRRNVRYRLHVVSPVTGEAVRVTTYVASFVYVQRGKKIVEDVSPESGHRTSIFKMHKKLMKALLGIEVREV